MEAFEIYKVKNEPVILEVLIADTESSTDIGLELVGEHIQDPSTQYHVPYIIEQEDGYLVKIGKDKDHPMIPEHHIQMVEIHVDDFLYRKYLKPDDSPHVYFKVPKGEKVHAKEYCNLHGLWGSFEE